MTHTGDMVTLFAGGGGTALGGVLAGYTPVMAVEADPDIAAVYAVNVSPCVRVARVEDVDPRPYAGVDLLTASPPCPSFSLANTNRGETTEDLSAAQGVCDWLTLARPDRFLLENVTGYRDSESLRLILRTLQELRYTWDATDCNFADLGVPQTRTRLIVRAVRAGALPPFPRTHCDPARMPHAAQCGLFGDVAALMPWNGWYDAISDLLPGLPESRLADWQIKRLPTEITTLLVGGANTSDVQAAPGVGVSYPDEPSRCVATNAGQWRAVLIEGDAAGDRPPTCRTPAEPAFTLKTSSGGRVHRALLISDQTGASGRLVGVRDAHEPASTVLTRDGGGSNPRAILPDGILPEQCRVVALSPRCLARLQTFPDWYELPPSRTLASKILGNAVPRGTAHPGGTEMTTEVRP